MRMGAFGTRDTRKFIGSNVKDANDECAFKVFRSLCRAVVEGRVRPDDPNKVDGVVLARNGFECVVEVWLPILGTDKEVRDTLLRRIRKILKAECGLEKHFYECHFQKNDKYFGYVFDGQYWSN